MGSSWQFWILASAVFLSLYDLAKKAGVRENAVLPVLLCSTLFGCAAFVGSLAGSGGLKDALWGIDRRIVLLSGVKALIVSSSWIFTFLALRTLPVTIATPIRASAPALVFLVALFLYREIPTPLQGLGMLLVFCGYWAFSWAGRYEGIDFFRNRAVWCAICGAILSACSALFDKYVFQVVSASVESVQLLFQIGLVVVYAVSLLVARVFARRIRLSSHQFEWRWTIPLIGVFLAAADWLYFHGLALPGAPVSVLSLMRRFSVVLTFALGAILFREVNLRRKAFALSVVLAGVIVLCLF